MAANNDDPELTHREMALKLAVGVCPMHLGAQGTLPRTLAHRFPGLCTRAYRRPGDSGITHGKSDQTHLD